MWSRRARPRRGSPIVTPDAPESPPEVPPATWRRDVLAATACLVAGLLLSLLPNLIWWPRHGEPVWVEDRDELIYLASSYRACHDHVFHLSDLVQEGDHPVSAPWLQFMPFVLACRALSLGPMAIPVLW